MKSIMYIINQNTISSMEPSPSYEATSPSTTQEPEGSKPHLQEPPLVSALCQMN
jgi:hypothetical protein